MLFEPWRALLAVAHRRSVRQASAMLGLAPSSVTRQLQLLRHLLRAELFEHGPAGMRLTAAGQLAYEYARSALGDLDRLVADIGELRDGGLGTIRLAVVESVVSGSLMGAVAAFRGTHPRVTFQLSVFPAPAVVDVVGRGEVDLGITFNQPAQPAVQVVALMREPICLALAPGHGFRPRTPLHLASLTALPLAMPDKTFGMRRDVEMTAAAQRVVLTPVLESNSFEALRAFARSGAGGVLLPATSLLHDVRHGTLLAHELGDEGLGGTSLQLIVPAAAGQSPSLVKRFIATTRDVMTDWR